MLTKDLYGNTGKRKDVRMGCPQCKGVWWNRRLCPDCPGSVRLQPQAHRDEWDTD